MVNPKQPRELAELWDHSNPFPFLPSSTRFEIMVTLILKKVRQTSFTNRVQQNSDAKLTPQTLT
ncbi:hypothetical protein BIY21_17925 [Vibrio ponticus]|uniref:Uncharacterized protein n=1 Tax=Vibrio ponticus TaxID=265668 RepID=A0ABX3FCE5_9VIBR|nr:hypothetical protein BIY21_17925 [Vibrio ponticus]